MAGNALPDQIVESIAISNAKSIGEQPAILSNLALANQILNNNMQQQLALSQQQAMNQITMATVSKCIAVITDPKGTASEDSKSITSVIQAMEKLSQAWEKITAQTMAVSPGPTAEGK
jgi:hypothetical protein